MLEFQNSRIPESQNPYSQEVLEIMTDYDPLLGEILNRGPSSETLGLVLSELKRLGRTRKVIQECIKALQYHPDDLPLRLILAEAYFEEGLFSHAEAELETATSQMDRYASAYWLQAEIYSAQKRNDEALRSLRIYLSLRPQDERALDLLKTLDIPQAAPATENAPIEEEITEPTAVKTEEAPVLTAIEPLEIEAEKPEFRFEDEVLSEIATPTLAEVYVNQGQLQEAISIYERVLAQNPEDEASLSRVQALRDILQAEPPHVEEVPRAKQRKQKTIAILESWLANIRKMSEDTVSA
jgi:tetratricopeptide (TPR) repeat protein